MKTFNFICHLNFLPQIYSSTAEFWISNTVEKLKDTILRNFWTMLKF